jgi:hypothetical protein
MKTETLTRKEMIKIMYNNDLENRCNQDLKTIEGMKEDRDFYSFVSLLNHKELTKQIIEILIRENKNK